MTRNGIIGAGNWLVDKVKLIDRWPGEGNLCNISKQIAATGGGPANVLFDLAAMDPSLPLFAAGLVGKDNEGDFILNEIKKRNIDSSGMLRTDKADTSYTDVMSGNGRRTFFHCRGANALLDCDMLSGIDVPAKFFYLAYLLLLDSLDASDPEFGTRAARLLSILQKHGYKTVVDFVSEAPEKFRRIVMPSLPYTDILVVNEVEASACSGIELRRADGSINGAGLPGAVKFLLDNGVKETVVIHFPEGACGMQRGGEFVYAPSCYIARADIVGSNGAGDAYCAGVMYALHQDWSLEDALKLGSASSHFNLKSATASGGAVSLAEMKKFLVNCKYEPMIEGLP
ncbi:MAG: carbohydrate kinase family protein [Victivallaceae bacterium]|nr:carbohydrate kinase family protein [Victivallaceae bacterium]